MLTFTFRVKIPAALKRTFFNAHLYMKCVLMPSLMSFMSFVVFCFPDHTAYPELKRAIILGELVI